MPIAVRLFPYQRAFLATGMAVTLPLTSVLASWRDFGDIRRLQYSEPLRQAQLSDGSGLNCSLAPNNLIQVAFQL